MTRDDVLRLLLAAADDLDRVFNHDEIARWPSGTREQLEEMGVLRRSSGGLTAPCPNCDDGHIEPVVVRADHGGHKRLFIQCPEALRVEVTADMCQGWEVDREGLVRAITSAMDLKGLPKAVVPDRLWRLGRMPWDGKTREVLLATRLRDDDAASVAARVPKGGRSIVLVPTHAPDERIWPGRCPAMVELSRITTLGADALVVDGVALMESVAEADQAIADGLDVPLDEVAAKKVAKHVTFTIESMTTNEALVQAYRVHGSYRKTADALSAQGYATDRWAVERAVKAAGGPKKVKESRDSASVSRTVASQPRDRSRKFGEYGM